MTIRTALLRAFFWMVLGSIVVMAALSFFQFRRALQGEIANNLQFGASSVMQRIDTFLFSQLENVRVWRNIEVMQDIRVNDVDKRLSHFLSDLRTGQGTVYQALFCTDRAGRIVAASDPALIGRQQPTISGWRKVPGMGLDDVLLAPVSAQQGNVVALRTAIPNAFGSGNIGNLYAMLNWDAVLDLLDKAVAGGPRSAVLLDAEGHVIGASQTLRDRLVLSQLNLKRWNVPRAGAVTYIHDGAALGYRSLLVGAATAAGYQRFLGLGWHLLMVEPTSVSFRPVWHLLWAMSGLLLFTLAAAVWISSRLASRIAQPITELTAFTRLFRQGVTTQPPLSTTTLTEVGELNRAFAQMIEALERSREQVVRAGKLAVVGEMAATMAHEVRTPLGIVRSSAQLLERQSDLSDSERELIGYIVSETERLNRLVTMLLECASPKPPVFKAHDLHAIIDNVLNLLESKAQKGSVRLVRQFEADDPVFECDREQIVQVILNLVLNALHFVPEDGRVAVATRRGGGTLWICVADDGPGVAPEIRERIFDPFFSRREGGIGLGLTVVQQIVQVHGGEIEVTGSQWGGASFNMRFDLTRNVRT